MGKTIALSVGLLAAFSLLSVALAKPEFSHEEMLDRVLEVADKPASLDVSLGTAADVPEGVNSSLTAIEGRNVGRIVVSTKLAGLLGTDGDRWTAVLAHETAHLILRHGFIGDAEAAKKSESEADRYGMLYLVQAGYPIAAYRQTWEFCGKKMGWEAEKVYQDRLAAMKDEEGKFRYLNDKFQIARAQIALGHFKGAKVLLEEIQQKFPRNVSTLNNLAIAYIGLYTSGNYPGKIDVVETTPADTRRILAPALLWGIPVTKTWEMVRSPEPSRAVAPNELIKAKSLLVRARELDPENEKARAARLSVEVFILRETGGANRGDAMMAAGECEKALRSQGKETAALLQNNLALYKYEVLGDVPAAVKLLKASLENGGGNFALYNLGMIGSFDGKSGISRSEAKKYLADFHSGSWNTQSVAKLVTPLIDKVPPAEKPDTATDVTEKAVRDIRDKVAKGYAPAEEPEITNEYAVTKLKDGSVLFTYTGKDGETISAVTLSPGRSKELIKLYKLNGILSDYWPDTPPKNPYPNLSDYLYTHLYCNPKKSVCVGPTSGGFGITYGSTTGQ